MMPLSLEDARNRLYRRKATPSQPGSVEWAEDVWWNYCYAPTINRERHGIMCGRVWRKAAQA